jgi:hypothetical protein
LVSPAAHDALIATMLVGGWSLVGWPPPDGALMHPGGAGGELQRVHAVFETRPASEFE